MFRASAEEAGVCSEQNGADRGRHTPRDPLKLSPIPGGPKEHILLGEAQDWFRGILLKVIAERALTRRSRGLAAFKCAHNAHPKWLWDDSTHQKVTPAPSVCVCTHVRLCARKCVHILLTLKYLCIPVQHQL